MGGIWSRKFDYKNGEDRVCNICGNKFHTPKPINRCKSCVNAKQKIIETEKRSNYKKKDKYPFDNRSNEAGARFCSIRTALSNAWKEYRQTGNRDVIKAHYDKQLKEITENGILTWILDRRTIEGKRTNNPNVRTRNMIRKEYPSTKDLPYEY